MPDATPPAIARDGLGRAPLRRRAVRVPAGVAAQIVRPLPVGSILDRLLPILHPAAGPSPPRQRRQVGTQHRTGHRPRGLQVNPTKAPNGTEL